MSSRKTVCAFVVLIVVAALLFEMQNVWPFNQDRVTFLRFIFGGCAFASLMCLAIGQRWWLPATLLAVGFTATSVLSEAQFTLAYLLSCAVLVGIAGGIGLLSGRRLSDSQPPIP